MTFKWIGVTALLLAFAPADQVMADGSGHGSGGHRFHGHALGRGPGLGGGPLYGRALGGGYYGYYAGGYYPADYYSDHYYPHGRYNRGYYIDYDYGRPYPAAVAADLAAVSGYCASRTRFIDPGSGPYYIYDSLNRPCQ